MPERHDELIQRLMPHCEVIIGVLPPSDVIDTPQLDRSTGRHIWWRNSSMGHRWWQYGVRWVGVAALTLGCGVGSCFQIRTDHLVRFWTECVIALSSDCVKAIKNLRWWAIRCHTFNSVRRIELRQFQIRFGFVKNIIDRKKGDPSGSKKLRTKLVHRMSLWLRCGRAWCNRLWRWSP